MRSHTRLVGRMVLIILCTGTLVAGQDVRSNFDSRVDFSMYRTYSWLNVDMPNSIWSERAKRTIEEALHKRGWSRVDEESDVSIVAIGTTAIKTELSAFYSSMPEWRWYGWGVGATTVVPVNQREGTLIIDIYETKSKRLIWRSSATDTVRDDPQKNVKKLTGAVKKMFKKFPPGAGD